MPAPRKLILMMPAVVLTICLARPGFAVVLEAGTPSSDGAIKSGAHLVRRQRAEAPAVSTRSFAQVDAHGDASLAQSAGRANPTGVKVAGYEEVPPRQAEIAWPTAVAAAASNAGQKSSLLQTDVQWEPVMRGALGTELNIDLGLMLETQAQPRAVMAALQHAAPDEQEKCGCALDRWDQYSVCYGAYVGASSAWSFGINGYDPWGEHVLYRARTVPRTFDCFVQQAPAFWNEFSPVCLGTKHETNDGRQYTTLQTLLSGVPDASALVKLDVEMQEWSVLWSLGADDFKRIRSLNVEYHFNYHCPTARELKMAERVLAHVKEHLVVVDSAAAYYSDPCLVDGVSFPKILAVSYAAPSACFPQDWVPSFAWSVLIGAVLLAVVVLTLPCLIDVWQNPPSLKVEPPSWESVHGVGYGWLLWIYSGCLAPVLWVCGGSTKAAAANKGQPRWKGPVSRHRANATQS